MSISDELEKLSKLKTEGVMSEAEFEKAKQRLLNGDDSVPSSTPSTDSENHLSTGGADFNVNQWVMFLHLSQLANFIIPGAGIVAPIVLWQMKKDQSAVVDQHGKMVTNWVISLCIYAAVCFALFIVLIGALLLPALLIVSAVFAVVGGIKANNGEYWEYPMSIKFIK